jgi:hypothetical protein
MEDGIRHQPPRHLLQHPPNRVVDLVLHLILLIILGAEIDDGSTLLVCCQQERVEHQTGEEECKQSPQVIPGYVLGTWKNTAIRLSANSLAASKRRLHDDHVDPMPCLTFD